MLVRLSWLRIEIRIWFGSREPVGFQSLIREKLFFHYVGNA